jgi:hypothetical protein
MSTLLKTELKMKKLILQHMPHKVKVYDVEKKQLIKEYSTMKQAAEELGVKNVHFYRKSKCKCYKNNLGITICFR